MASVHQLRPKPFVPPKPHPTPHPFPEYQGPETAGQHIKGLVNPEDLHKLLDVAPFVRITFPTEKKLLNFRHNLYKVNVEGKFRYATRREGWCSLVILRMK